MENRHQLAEIKTCELLSFSILVCSLFFIPEDSHFSLLNVYHFPKSTVRNVGNTRHSAPFSGFKLFLPDIQSDKFKNASGFA
ncbi:MAG: hypothetical protein RPR97_02115, partial [Colwellia sp.]